MYTFLHHFDRGVQVMRLSSITIIFTICLIERTEWNDSQNKLKLLVPTLVGLVEIRL
jgi:hypothetical protein